MTSKLDYTLQDRKDQTCLPTKHVHKMDISDPLSFTDSTSVILSYLTVKELLSLHCVNESWYRLLTLQNDKNHHSIEFYSECIFNTIIKMDNPLFKQIYAIDDNLKFPQKCDSIKNDHFHELHLSHITKTNRNKFMKYTLPLIGQIANVALITAHKTQEIEESDSKNNKQEFEDNTDSENKNNMKQQVITLNIHKNILKLIQFIDFLAAMAHKLTIWNENNGNCSDNVTLTKSPMQWTPQFVNKQCQLQRLCYLISRYKTYISSTESEEDDSPSCNIVQLLDWYVSTRFPSVIKYVTKYSTKASLAKVTKEKQAATQFRRQCEDLVKQWPIYIHKHWIPFFYLNILNSTSIDASKWALSMLIGDDKNTKMLRQCILGSGPADQYTFTTSFFHKYRRNEMKYYINLTLVSIEILIQNGIKKFENEVLIEKISNALNGRLDYELINIDCHINISKEFDPLVMKIIEMMVNLIDVVDEHYTFFEYFFCFFVDLIEMPRRIWRAPHSYSYNFSYCSDYMKQIQRSAQFVKIFDQENAKHGKWCIGQIISFFYNKEKKCKQFQVCVGVFLLLHAMFASL